MSSTVILLVLILCLISSLFINLFLIWYTWSALKQVNYYDTELREIVGVIQNFTNHLEVVYEMEMFYGDETLRFLLQHAKDLTEAFSQYNTHSEETSEELEEKLNDDITE